MSAKVEQPPCLTCGREREHMKGCPAIGHEKGKVEPLECLTPDAPKTVIDRGKARNPFYGKWLSE